MADVSFYEELPVSAQTAWDVIGDFGGIQKWAPIIQESAVDETPDGEVRTLTMGDGAVVREVLVATSQFSYSYSLLDKPELPGHRSTVAVVPLTSATCALVLSVHVTATPELTEEALTDRYEKFVAGNSKAMKRAIGIPRD